MTALHKYLSFCAVKLSNLCYGAQMLTRFEPTRTSLAQKKNCIVATVLQLNVNEIHVDYSAVASLVEE